MGLRTVELCDETELVAFSGSGVVLAGLCHQVDRIHATGYWNGRTILASRVDLTFWLWPTVRRFVIVGKRVRSGRQPGSYIQARKQGDVNGPSVSSRDPRTTVRCREASDAR
jgi:hypothetical protein